MSFAPAPRLSARTPIAPPPAMGVRAMGLPGLPPGMAPPPGMPPPIGGMGMPPPAVPIAGGMAPPPPPSMSDPAALIQQLTQLVGGVQGPPEPMYAPNYDKPKKPDPQLIYELGKKRKDEYLVRNWLYDKIIKQLRLQLVGVFPEDEEDRRNGFQEEFISPELRHEFDLAVSFMAGLAYTAEKKVLDPTKRADAQKLEDALFWLRDEDLYRHSERGNSVLAVDEAKVLLGYGMIVGRDVMNLKRPDFPFDTVLLDPATVYPEWWGQEGLGRCWQIVRTTTGRVLHDFDPPERIAKVIKDHHGSDEHDEVEHMDFYDTWHHLAYAGDIVIHEAPHEYGYVPVTIQYGPGGDAMFTSAPGEIPVRTHNGTFVTSETRWQDDLAHKALPYIFYNTKTHEQYEAIMARLITGMKKDINPPLILERSDAIANTDRPQIETGPGAVNELDLGNEKLNGFPTTPSMQPTQLLIQALLNDKNAGGLTQLVRGQRTQSNVTGVAQNAFIDQGYDMLDPWKQTMELFHARRATQKLISWRNFGHLAAYQGADKPAQRLTIPRRRPKQGEAPAFELTPALIDGVGPRVAIHLTRIDPSKWVPLANAAQALDPLGLFDPRFFAPYFGITDIDRYLEEAAEYQTMRHIRSHPKYVEIVLAPQTLIEEIREEGDPIRRETLLTQLEMWLNTISAEAAAPPQPPGMPPGMPGPMQGVPAAMGPPGAGGPQNPNTSAGVSYPALGQGPGSQSGMTGRPAGV